MFLSDVDILKEVENGKIRIDNFEKSRLQGISYDVLLGNRFMQVDSYKTAFIDPVNGVKPELSEVLIPDGDKFILHPGASVLAEVHDFVGSDEYLIQLSGKSSLARIGLIVHNTAGIINPGHYLNIVLELCNLASVPIFLHPKMEIAQLLFSKISSKPSHLYADKGRYASQNWSGYKETN